jgi:hypothetical protein
MSWTWRYVEVAGAAAVEQTSPSFPTQADAESWIGETWQELLDGGVDAVYLLDDATEVYGPMSLRPPQ